MSLKFNPITGNLDVVLDKASEINYTNTTSGLTATNTQTAIDEIDVDVDNLQTLSGVAANATSLGTFTGTTIPDNSTNKQAIQSLETALEGIPTPISYKGTWNASTNTPALANSDVGKLGYLYQVIVAGTQNFGAGAIVFDVNDKVVNNGTIWEKWDQTDAVNSVNGYTGAVVLAKADVGLSNVDNTSDATKNSAVATLTNKTLTSPVINSPTGLVKADVGLSNVDNTSDATKNAAVATLTNKTISTATNSISGIADANIATGANIDAAKIGTGIVSNTEFNYLDGVTSAIQTQLDSKASSAGTVTLTGTQTLTNKTLTAPVINSPTGLVKADVGLSNVDNTSDATKNAATATLTNKTLSGNTATNLVNGSGVFNFNSGSTITVPNANDTLVGKATSDILTNKTLTSPVINSPTGIVKADVGLSNVDNTSDATKNSAVATLTNKTLTAPVINSPTGLVKADVGLGSVDNTSDATKNSAVATLINKTIDADLNTITNIKNADIKAGAAIDAAKIADGSVTSAEFQFINSLTSNAQTQLDNKQPLDSTLTSLAAYNTNGLLTQTAADTFTGRTLTAGSTKVAVTNGNGVAGNPTVDVTEANLTLSNLGGTLSIAKGGTGQTTQTDAFDALAPTTTKGDTIVHNGTDNVRVAVGTDYNAIVADSIATSGVRYAKITDNLLTYGDFENNSTTGWSLGNVALTSNFPSGSPTFGSGASGNLALSVVSSGQLNGTYSLSYASSAATTAGDFVASSTFSVSLNQQAKVLQFSFSYKAQTNPTNGNFSGTSSNSFGVAVYDVTNSVWIQPAGVYNLVQSSGVGTSSGTFQTSSNGTSYRILVYNANASSGAITMYFDDFKVSSQVVSNGAAVSDMQTVTAAASSWTTNTTTTTKVGRVGDHGIIEWNLALAGAPNNTSLLLNLPSGYTIDTAKLTNSGTSFQIDGTVNGNRGAAAVHLVPIWSSTTQINIVYLSSISTGAVTQLSTTAPVTWASGDNITCKIRVPIVGWSSNSVVSSDTDTRVIAATGSGNPNNTISGTASKITWASTPINNDTHGAWSSANNNYVVPVTGFYKVKISTEINQTTVLGSSASVGIKTKNSAGTTLTTRDGFDRAFGAGTTTQNAFCEDVFKLNTSDTIEFESFATGTAPTYSTSISGTYFSIERLSGPAQVAASESVAAIYTDTSAAAIGTSAANYTYTTKVKDTHNAYSGGVFIAPVSGTYEISAIIQTASVNLSTSQLIQMFIFFNSTQIAAYFQYGNGVAHAQNCLITGSYSLVAGDTLKIQILSSVATNGTSSSGCNMLSIKRTGN